MNPDFSCGSSRKRLRRGSEPTSVVEATARLGGLVTDLRRYVYSSRGHPVHSVGSSAHRR